MAGKKQKRSGATVSLADALTATRAAHRRVLALAARLEETERTILAAMASEAAPRVAAPTTPAKRPVGRPPKATTAPVKRPVGRPRTRPAGAATTTTRSGTGPRRVGRPPKS